MTDPTPKPKVVAGGLAGAATAVILYLLSTFAHVEVPGEVGAGITTVMAFVLSYITSDK